MQVEDWNDLRLFLAIARAPSLAAAAQGARVDTSTISRRLAALEGKAGRTLVRRGRGQGQARLTAAGEELAQLAGAVEQAVLAAERWPHQARKDRVRLTAPEELVSLVLTPALPALLRAAPWLRVDLIGAAQVLRLRAGEADLALRMSRPKEAGLVARSVASVRYSVYSTRGGPKPNPDQWLGLDETVGPWPELAWAKSRWPKVPPVLRAGSWGALLAAAVAGLGQAILPDALAGADPRLLKVAPQVGERKIWLVLPAELRREPSVRAVSAWAVESLQAALRRSQA